MRMWLALGVALVAAACSRPAPTYGPEVEFNFMRACEERSQLPGLCACIWEKVEAEVDPNDFVALEQLPGPAREAHPLTAQINGYAAACYAQLSTPAPAEPAPAP
jgi:hypothetical protein